MIKAAKRDRVWPFMIPAVYAIPGVTLVPLLETSMLRFLEVSTNITVKRLERVLISWKHLDAVTS